MEGGLVPGGPAGNQQAAGHEGRPAGDGPRPGGMAARAVTSSAPWRPVVPASGRWRLRLVDVRPDGVLLQRASNFSFPSSTSQAKVISGALPALFCFFYGSKIAGYLS
jgi:hypothetical protein